MDENIPRFIHEAVPGRQITLAHVIPRPKPELYQKLGLNPKLDYSNAAIGLMTLSPAEMAIIGADIATKSADIELGFVDRFSGTLIVTGSVSHVESTIKQIIQYAETNLKMAVCPITRT